MLVSRVWGEMGDGWEVVVLFSHLQESSNLVYSHLFLHKLCTDGVQECVVLRGMVLEECGGNCW